VVWLSLVGGKMLFVRRHRSPRFWESRFDRRQNPIFLEDQFQRQIADDHSQTHAFWRSAALCFLSSTILALLTFICFRLHALPSVAALLYMVVIVLVSLQGRFIPAIFASIVAIFCLDYFFVKPVFRITLAESLDVVALVAYSTTALVVTGLLSRVRKSLRELHRSTAALELALAEVKSLNVELRRTNEELRIQISERKQAQEALRVSEQQRIAQLAKANEALRGCLDTLAQVPELDDFLGQVMAAITRKLGAVFSTLRMLDVEP
jgi:K+-sensing histidine kinase KdpD